MLSFRLSGLFLLRYAARQFLALLFQDPPRNTRGLFGAGPAALTAARPLHNITRLVSSRELAESPNDCAPAFGGDQGLRPWTPKGKRAKSKG